MTNRYILKASSNQQKAYLARGWVNPAWQENSIARDHGHESATPEDLIKAHSIGKSRRLLRGLGEGLAGAVAGGVLGTIAGRKYGYNPSVDQVSSGIIGAGLGAISGAAHGVHKSLKNQAHEAHNRYLNKIAKLSDDTKRDLVHTGLIGAIGGGTTYGAMELAPKLNRLGRSGKFAVGTGLGWLGDYVAVKSMPHADRMAGLGVPTRSLSK